MNSYFQNGRCPLHEVLPVTAKYLNPTFDAEALQFLRLLIEGGADVNATTEVSIAGDTLLPLYFRNLSLTQDGNTALHITARLDKFDLSRYLVQVGANLMAQDKVSIAR